MEKSKKVNWENRTQEIKSMDMAQKFGMIAVCVAEKVVVTIIDKILDEIKSRERGKTKKDQESKTTKDLESKTSKAFQDLKNKVEDLQEDFRKLEGSTQDKVQLLTEELEKNQGKELKERARALESRLRKNVRQLSRRIETLKEDVEDWPNTIKYELQVRRAELEKIQEMNEEDIALALDTMLKKNVRQLSQKIQTLEDDVQECLETIKFELQVLRDEVQEKNQGKKEGDIASTVESTLKGDVQQLSQRIQNLEQVVKEWPNIIKYEFQLLRADLEKNQGKKEE